MRLFYLILAIVVGLPSSAQSGTFEILATHYPLYVFAKNISDGVNEVHVHTLNQSHRGCAHDYRLTPIDTQRAVQASLVFYNGTHVEKSLEKLLKVVAKENLVGTAGANNMDNEHLFSDPHLASRQVKLMAEKLIARLPKHRKLLESNAKAYTVKLNALTERLKQLHQQKQIVVMSLQPSLDLLLQAAGLSVFTELRDSEFSTHRSETFKQFSKWVDKNSIRALFSDTNQKPRIAHRLAEVANIPLNHLESVAGGPLPAPKDRYEKRMRDNIKILREFIRGQNAGL